MAYGIGLAVEGLNRGYDEYRDRKRQEGIDAEQSRLREMQMENYGLQMDSRRQQMGQQATEHGWRAQAHDRLTGQQEEKDLRTDALSAAQRQDWERFAELSAQIGGYSTGRIARGEDGKPQLMFGDMGEDGSFDPDLITEFDPTTAHRTALSPEKFFQELDEDTRLLQQARIEAAAARKNAINDHIGRGISRGSVQVGFGEDGGLTYSQAPEGAMNDMIGKVNPSLYTPGSVQRFSETGRWADLQFNESTDNVHVREARAQANRYIDTTEGLTALMDFVSLNPPMAKAAGITENMGPAEANLALANYLASDFANRANAGYGISGSDDPDGESGGEPAPDFDLNQQINIPGPNGQMSSTTPQKILSAASAEVADGTDPREVAEELRSLGLPDSVVSEWYGSYR